MTHILKTISALFIFCALLSGAIGLGVYKYYAKDLPDYTQLAHYDPPIVTRIYATDGRLLTEYATENRVFVPIQAIPKRLINAFLAAEDKTFYSHKGIDLPGVVQAFLTNFFNKIQGADRRPVGASTITQQVAKNFLLTNELSLARKVKEIILAYRIEQAFSKDRILELYLNEIYLGTGNYGVVSASLNYFNKSLDDLTVSEAAYLAALPKAPNHYHPVHDYEAAKSRRDWVIGRMAEDGYITEDQKNAALAEPLQVKQRGITETARADYFAEEVRRQIINLYGDDVLYKGGLVVRTSLDPRLQAIADKYLKAGMLNYDRRHGYRGPLNHFNVQNDWQQKLSSLPIPPDLGSWKVAVVLSLTDSEASIGFNDGKKGTIPLAELKWARLVKKTGWGKVVAKPSDVLTVGDVVLVENISDQQDRYTLRQIPEIGAALVALDPHTGRVLAMTGGWSYKMSEFNRATQAKRQPGSSFKPFVYMAALDSGYTPSTLILDAPVTVNQGPGMPLWTPKNYTHEYSGPTTMRVGVEKSKNLMTVRMAQAVGMPKIVEYAKKFGIDENMLPVFSMALGAGETTVLKLTTAYAMIVNGGKKIDPSFIDRIQDRNGKTTYRYDQRTCPECFVEEWKQQVTPKLTDTRAQIEDPLTAYQMVSILEGVVQRGTGSTIRSVGKPLAGKTGTSNDYNDAWFVGFSPDLAVGVYFGFDQPRSLGNNEAGAGVAAPVFRDFMNEALKDQPGIPFRIPPGIRLIRVDATTGQRSYAGSNVILEAFKPGTEPDASQQQVITGEAIPQSDMFGITDGEGMQQLPSQEEPSGNAGGLY
ncbi:MAG: penicillin-binding protein 1A [Alphaproteobacteria bacterium]|nr:penicillin-binding protein 1A [Alphaproteobacteria bacterium]